MKILVSVLAISYAFLRHPIKFIRTMIRAAILGAKRVPIEVDFKESDIENEPPPYRTYGFSPNAIDVRSTDVVESSSEEEG